MQAAESRAKTEAMLAGQDGEAFDAIRAAERNLKRAEANSLISDILRRANGMDVGPVASVTPRPVWATPDPAVTEAEPLTLDTPAPPELTEAQRRGRAGGLATAQARAAAKARDGSYILVPSLVSRIAEAQRH